MEIEVSSSSNPPSSSSIDFEEQMKNHLVMDRVRVKRKTLRVVLEQCQRALELLNNTDCGVEDDDGGGGAEPQAMEDDEPGRESFPASPGDREANEWCDLLKSRVECPDFLEKLEFAQVSVPQNITEEGNSWDMVSENDLWDGENGDSDQEDYVVVRQEDIVDGIACFMAAYLLSLKQTKDLNPNQLQEARLSLLKRERESFGKLGTGAKSFIT